MFIRRKIVKGKTYFQVVESYRDGTRVRHRNIVSLGRYPTPKEALRKFRASIKMCERQLALLRPRYDWEPKNEKRCAYMERMISGQRDKISRLKTAIKGLVVDTTAAPRST